MNPSAIYYQWLRVYRAEALKSKVNLGPCWADLSKVEIQQIKALDLLRDRAAQVQFHFL